MSEAATPAAPAATPATPAPGVETVTLSKEEHEQLTRDAARAASAQRKLDLLTRGGTANNGSNFRGVAPAKPAAAPTQEQADEQAIIEDRKAERGLLAVAADPAFREVLDADPSLRQLLTVNPLGVLPLLAPDAFDAEDAIALVKGELSKRASALKKPVTPAEPPKPAAPVPPTPPAGGVNTPSVDVNEKYEAAKKIPNTESAVANMIGAKLGGLRSSK